MPAHRSTPDASFMTLTRWSPLFRIALVGLLLLVLAATGGASRGEASQQMIVRIAAILIIAATLLPLRPPVDRWPPRSWWWIGGCYALVAIQLVPLPPSFWAALPGHTIYAQVADAAGMVAWRPISLTPDLTTNALLALLPATAAALAMHHTKDADWVRIVSWIAAIALFSAAFGLMQLAAGDPVALKLYRISTPDSATGLFANRNHNAYFLSAALPLIGALARYWHDQSDPSRLIVPAVVAAGLTLLIGVVATQSRMGLVTGIIGTAMALYIFLAHPKKRGRPALPQRTLAIGGGVAAAAVALLAIFAWRAGLLARIAATDLAAESRTQQLDPMLRTAWGFMPIGSGFGSFDAVFRRFEPLDLLSTTYLNQAHNEPLQLAIEGGVPALALLGLFLWWWAGQVRTALRRRRPVMLATAGATFILMLASLVDYPLRTPLCSVFFVIACVLLARPDPAISRRQLKVG